MRIGSDAAPIKSVIKFPRWRRRNPGRLCVNASNAQKGEQGSTDDFLHSSLAAVCDRRSKSRKENWYDAHPPSRGYGRDR
jgi:hypothetical protein